MNYTTTSYSAPVLKKDWNMNPFSGLQESLDEFNKNVESFVDGFWYWINPLNWFIEANKGLHWLINQPETATFLVSGTIVGIWLIMLGANFPKKYLFWGWIVYWTLRGFVYKN